MIVFDTTNQIYGKKLTANENQAIADYFCCHGEQEEAEAHYHIREGLDYIPVPLKNCTFSFKSPDKMCTL